MGEVELGALLCGFLGGISQYETPLINYEGEKKRRIDCLTKHYAIEFALDDKDDARDSIHQAVLYAVLERKKPLIVLIDRNGSEDPYQQEIRIVADVLNIPYTTCSKDFIQRWDVVTRLSIAGLDKDLDDLPLATSVQFSCPLIGFINEIELRTE